MINGFSHDAPTWRDIFVSHEMEQVLHCQHVNAAVKNSRYDENKNIIADVEVNGTLYLVRNEVGVFGMQYWLLVATQENKLE